MATVIDDLIYKLGYETDKASLRDAQGGFKTLITAAAALTAAAVAAGAALSGLAMEAAAYGDDVAKTAQKLGIGTTELQKWRFAANEAGIETRTFDMALQRSVRRLSEAASGTGEAKNALIELGLSAKQLNSLSPDKQLLRIAEAMKKIPNQADRVRLSKELFDSEGVSMVNLLSKTEEQILASMDAFEAFGGVMSEEDTKNAEAFTDLMGRMWVIVKGLSRLLGAKLFVPLSNLMRMFGDWFRINKDIVNAGLIQFVDALLFSLKLLGTGLGVIWDIVAGLIWIWNSFEDSTKWFWGGLALAGILVLARGIAGPLLASLAPLLVPLAGISAALLLIQDIILWLQNPENDTLMKDIFGTPDELLATWNNFFQSLKEYITVFAQYWQEVIGRKIQAMKTFIGDIARSAEALSNKLSFSGIASTVSGVLGGADGRTSNSNNSSTQNNNFYVEGANDPEVTARVIDSALSHKYNSEIAASVGGTY